MFGLLGPNGAGKTTTVEILEGYRARTAASSRCSATTPSSARARCASGSGIVLQSCGIYRHITVREAVAHWARLYPRAARRRRGDRARRARRARRTRSRARSRGGQLRRLDFALALVGDPELIFLDEPTTGFDPAARRAAWDAIRSLQELGKTVLLTTHYLDEAQALADRVAIIKDGRILARGRPRELGAGAARYRVAWRDEDGELQERETDDPTALLHELTSAALARGERAARPHGHAADARGRLPRADRRAARSRRGQVDRRD